MIINSRNNCKYLISNVNKTIQLSWFIYKAHNPLLIGKRGTFCASAAILSQSRMTCYSCPWTLYQWIVQSRLYRAKSCYENGMTIHPCFYPCTTPRTKINFLVSGIYKHAQIQLEYDSIIRIFKVSKSNLSVTLKFRIK